MNAVVTPIAIVTQNDMDTWFQLTKQLELIKTQEMELRKKIFAYYFTQPKEGTNTVPLNAGWVIKGEYKINRSVDLPLLTNHMNDLRKKKVPVESLIKYEPKLVVAEYRKLDEKQRAAVDEVLKITVGSPSLEIVLPKKQAATPVPA